MNETWVGFISNAKLAESQAEKQVASMEQEHLEWLGLGA